MSKIGTQLNTKSAVLLQPHVTERSSAQSFDAERPVYTFEVAKHATKPEVVAAIKEAYKVTPLKVNVLNVRSKKIVIRGRVGYKAGFRKAMVFLKKGDKIDFV